MHCDWCRVAQEQEGDMKWRVTFTWSMKKLLGLLVAQHFWTNGWQQGERSREEKSSSYCRGLPITESRNYLLHVFCLSMPSNSIHHFLNQQQQQRGLWCRRSFMQELCAFLKSDPKRQIHRTSKSNTQPS